MDIIEARGGAYILYNMELQLGDQGHLRSGFVGQTRAQDCSKFLFLKSKIEFNTK